MNVGRVKNTGIRALSLAALVLEAACATGGAPTPDVVRSAVAPSAVAPGPVVETATVESVTSNEPATPTTSPTQTNVPAPSEPIFTVGVVVDTRSQAVTRDQAQALINEAGGHLKALIPVLMVMTDYVEDGSGGATTDILQRYIVAHESSLPDGIVILSFGDQDQAKISGGYNYTAPAPEGYRNRFVSPLTGSARIYVAVIDYGYRYMACGYGGENTVRSSSSLDGECGNHPGTACVQQNGYSMCASAVGHLYMSGPTYYAASKIIHELLQPFAPGGAQDDYSTPQCTAFMGYPAGFHDLQEAQYHNDLCPLVYDNFLKGYKP